MGWERGIGYYESILGCDNSNRPSTRIRYLALILCTSHTCVTNKLLFEGGIILTGVLSDLSHTLYTCVQGIPPWVLKIKVFFSFFNIIYLNFHFSFLRFRLISKPFMFIPLVIPKTFRSYFPLTYFLLPPRQLLASLPTNTENRTRYHSNVYRFFSVLEFFLLQRPISILA